TGRRKRPRRVDVRGRPKSRSGRARDAPLGSWAVVGGRVHQSRSIDDDQAVPPVQSHASASRSASVSLTSSGTSRICRAIMHVFLRVLVECVGRSPLRHRVGGLTPVRTRGEEADRGGAACAVRAWGGYADQYQSPRRTCTFGFSGRAPVSGCYDSDCVALDFYRGVLTGTAGKSAFGGHQRHIQVL